MKKRAQLFEKVNNFPTSTKTIRTQHIGGDLFSSLINKISIIKISWLIE
jgi:hypothetical protein